MLLLLWITFVNITVAMAMIERDILKASEIHKKYTMRESQKMWLNYSQKILAEFLPRIHLYVSNKDVRHVVYLKYLWRATGLVVYVSKREQVRTATDLDEFWKNVKPVIIGSMLVKVRAYIYMLF